jgi:hypothetical protein
MGRFSLAVRDYLDTCEDNAGLLSRKYHPTEDGAVKAIPHRGYRDKEADKAAEAEIRQTFRAERHRSRRPEKDS